MIWRRFSVCVACAALLLFPNNQAETAQSIYKRSPVMPRVPLGPGLQQRLQQAPRAPSAELRVGQTEILIWSRASVRLTIQVYRPNTRMWEQRILEPSSRTTINCPECGDTFRLSFFDGERQSEYPVARGSIVRIYSAPGSARWTLDSVRAN